MPSESTFTSRYQGVAQVFQGGEKSVYLSQRDAANNDAIVALDDHAAIRAQREHMQSDTADLTRKICLAKARKSLRRQIKLIETDCISAQENARDCEITIATLRKELSEAQQESEINAEDARRARLASEAQQKAASQLRDNALQTLRSVRIENDNLIRERDNAKRGAEDAMSTVRQYGAAVDEASRVAAAQIRQIETTNQELEIQVEKQRKELGVARDRQREAEGENQRLQQRVHAASEQIEVALAGRRATEETNKKLERQLQGKEEERVLSTNRQREAEEESRRLEQVLQTTRKTLETESTTRSTAEETNKKLERQLQQANRDLSDAEDKQQRTEEKSHDFERQLQQAKRDLSDARDKQHDTAEKNRALEGEIEEKAIEVADTKKELCCAKDHHSHASQNFETLRLLMQQAIKENDDMKKELQDKCNLERQLQHEIEQLQQKAQEQETALKTKEGECTELVSNATINQTQLHEANSKLEHTSAELQDVRRKSRAASTDSKDENQRLKRELTERDAELDVLRQTLTRNEGDIEKLQKSSQSDRELIEELESDVRDKIVKLGGYNITSRIRTKKSSEQHRTITELKRMIARTDARLRDSRVAQGELTDDLLIEKMSSIGITSLGELCLEHCDQKVQDDEVAADLTGKVSSLEQQVRSLEQDVGRHRRSHINSITELRHIEAAFERLTLALGLPSDDTEECCHAVEEMLQDLRLRTEELEACRTTSNNRGSLLKSLDQILGRVQEYVRDIEEIPPSIPHRVLRFGEMIARQTTPAAQDKILQQYAESQGLATPGKRKLGSSTGPSTLGRTRADDLRASTGHSPSKDREEDDESVDEGAEHPIRTASYDRTTRVERLHQLCLGKLPNILEFLEKEY